MKRFKSFIFIMLLTLILIPIKGLAVDKVTFAITDGPGTVKAGQEFTIKVKQSGANDSDKTLTNYSFKVTFESSVLEYLGGASSQNGNDLNISGKYNGNDELATLRFRVKDGAKEGSYNFPIKDVSCTVNGDTGDCGANSGSVKIRALGGDSSLSKLSIPNTPLSPAFNKNIRDYTANVKDVSQLTVNATASDQNAQITVSDNRNNLQKGENTIKVVCTAENGSSTTYTIKVNLELTPTEEELKLMNTNLSKLEIKGQKIEFNVEEVKYYLDVTYDVKELEITATPENEAAKVQITGADKLVVGKNTVNILVTAEDGTTTKTYSILVTRLAENKKIVPTCPDSTSIKEWIIFSVGLFLTFTLGIVLGYILGKKDILSKIFKKKEKVEEAVEIQTLSDTIDLSDVVEEIKDDEDVKKA
ncbi:MAG: cadherin-like beta sandwich domain-containing protein [Bacilli bacterium]|nr:cadherin-like beta sandwich domain-containing protein [Bacilli bacterium]